MSRTSVLLPAAAQLAPYQQGHVSSLCGLYSLLNGIQLVLWPHRKLQRRELKKLFASGVQHLDESRGLGSILGRGIDEDAWLDLSRSLIKQASVLTGHRISRRFILRRRAKLTCRTAITLIKEQLRAHRPVLVTLWGGYDHVTVIVGYSRGRLILFDSSGFRWIHEAGVGLQHPQLSKAPPGDQADGDGALAGGALVTLLST